MSFTGVTRYTRMCRSTRGPSIGGEYDSSVLSDVRKMMETSPSGGWKRRLDEEKGFGPVGSKEREYRSRLFLEGVTRTGSREGGVTLH